MAAAAGVDGELGEESRYGHKRNSLRSASQGAQRSGYGLSLVRDTS